MGSITITHLYEQLSSKFGKDSAETMTSFIDHKIKEDMADNLRILATKHDLAEGLAAVRVELAEGLAAVRGELAEGLAAVRGELAEGLASVRGEIAEVRGSLIAKIAETKSEMIKWMFIFWASQLTITLGFIHFFLKR